MKRRLLRRVSRKKGYTLGKGVAPTPDRSTTPSPQAAPKNGRQTRKPPSTQDGQKQQLPLLTLLTNLLAKSKRPLTARELADLVLGSGYQTKSKNIMNVIWVALPQMKNVERVPDKGYMLKR